MDLALQDVFAIAQGIFTKLSDLDVLQCREHLDTATAWTGRSRGGTPLEPAAETAALRGRGALRRTPELQDLLKSFPVHHVWLKR